MSEINSMQIIEKKKFKISFSQYSAYLNCQHRWYLQYVLRFPGEESPEFLFGTVVHGTIETIIKNKVLKKMYLRDKLGTLNSITRGIFNEEFAKINDATLIKRIKNEKLDIFFPAAAKKLLLELDFFTRFIDYDVVSVEFKLNDLIIFSNNEVEILFKGYIDLILKKKGEEKYLILDWKTSGKKWDIDKKIEDNKNFYTQLILYKYFYSSINNIPLENIDVAFYNLPRDNEKGQLIYAKDFSNDYVNEFVNNFKNKCFEIFQHKEIMNDYSKIKFITSKNWCSRCQFNNEEMCNNLDEFQKVLPPLEEKKTEK